MTPTTDLIARLREADKLYNRGPNYEPLTIQPSAVRLEAADALAAQEAELAEVKADRDAFESGCEYWSSETARVCGEASTLAAELARLREALAPFAAAAEHYDPPEEDDRDVAWADDFTIGSLRRAARALSGGGE